jgi:hypothetical protein
MSKKRLEFFYLTYYPIEKTDEIVQAIEDAGYTVAPHPGPDWCNICLYADSTDKMTKLLYTLRNLAPTACCAPNDTGGLCGGT